MKTNSLPLVDETRIYRVTAGFVDVFAVALGGARFHLWRAQQGEVLLGTDAGQTQLLAVAALDGSWQEIGFRELTEGDIEIWSEAWRRALHHDDAPATWNQNSAATLQNWVSNRQSEAQNRLEQRAALEASARSSAWNELSTVLHSTNESELSQPLSPTASALERACEAVAQAAGIAPETVKTASYTFVDENGALEAAGNWARGARLRSREVELNANWWREESGPLLGFWLRDATDSSSSNTNIASEAEPNLWPVALLPVRGGYRVWEPREGKTWFVDEANAAQIAPRGAMFYRPFPDRAMGALDLARFGLFGARRDMVSIAILSTIGGLLALLPPLVTAQIFDSVLPGSEIHRLWPFAILLATFALVTALLSAARGIAVLRVESRLDWALQSALWDRLMRLSPQFFGRFEAGDLAARAMAIGGVRSLLAGAIVAGISGTFFSLFNWALLFFLDARTALIATGVLIVAGAVTVAGGIVQLRHERAGAALGNALAGLTLQLLQGVAALQVAGATNRAFSVWAKPYAARQKAISRAQTATDAAASFDATLPLIALMALFFATAMGAQNRLSTGQFLAFSAAFGAVLAAFLETTHAALSLLRVVPLLESAAPILQTLPENDGGKIAPGELDGAIELSGVSFRYDSDGPLILDDVSLRIEAGQFVAFVGASGSGKSTLLRLLLGFEHAQSGGIYLDGRDLASLDIDEVRRQFGVVLQNGRLLPGSIQSNIAGAGHLSLSDAWIAAERAGLSEEIAALPMGMHTVIGEGGGFSGGQKQRVLIARAIARSPKILLFDEATSALDNLTQAQVSRSLELLRATRLVVAHRLSTVRGADLIVMIAHGKIVETGRYDELLARDGAFAALVSRQLA